MLHSLKICLTIVTLFCSDILANFDIVSDERYKVGKEGLVYLKEEAKAPKFGSCWLDAIERLEIGCSNLTEDELHKMTFSFMNCFLLKTGRAKQECPSYLKIEDCTRRLKTETYGVYTKFFTHTQNVCFFLQSQKWQQDTKLIINKLSETSEGVANQMESSSELQSEILKRQSDSIRMQESLLERGAVLKKTIDNSRVDLDKMMQDFKTSSSEQKRLIFEIFDKVKILQTLIVEETSGFFSLIFYLSSVLVCHLLTTAPQTHRARLLLFFIMTLNLVIERILFSRVTSGEQEINGRHLMLSETDYYTYRDLSRTMAAVISTLVLIYTIYKFKDYKIINNNLLNEIKSQNNEIKQLLQSPLNSKFTEGKLVNTSFCDSKVTDLDSSASSLGCSSDSSSSTLDRTDDKTFQLDSSFVSQTSTLDLKEDMEFLSTSTPYKNLFSSDFLPNFTRFTDKSQADNNKTSETASFDHKVTPESDRSCYNLRPRRAGAHQCSVIEETPIEFGKKVKAVARESTKICRKAVDFRRLLCNDG